MYIYPTEYYYLVKLMKMRGGHGKDENCVQNFSKKTKHERPLGSPRRRTGKLFKRIFRSTYDGVDLVQFPQGLGLLAGACKYGNELRDSKKKRPPIS